MSQIHSTFSCSTFHTASACVPIKLMSILKMYSKNDAKVVLFVLIYKQKTGLFDVCLKYIAYLCAFLKNLEMTKAELCKSISAKTGCDAQTVLAVVESLMVEVKESLERERMFIYVASAVLL